MYLVLDGEIWDDGKNLNIKAAQSKAELAEQYGWSRDTLRKRLNKISHLIYEKDEYGNYKNRKKKIEPFEVHHIYNYFGIP